MVRNSPANQGHMARSGTGAATKLQSGASWGSRQGLATARSSSVSCVRKTLKQRALPLELSSSSIQQNKSLTSARDPVLLFPAQQPKIHSQKASNTKAKPLVMSRQFWTPGSLHKFLLIAVRDYLKGMKGS